MTRQTPTNPTDTARHLVLEMEPTIGRVRRFVHLVNAIPETDDPLARQSLAELSDELIGPVDQLARDCGALWDIIRGTPINVLAASLEPEEPTDPTPAPANDPTEPTAPTLAPDAAQHVETAFRAVQQLDSNLEELARFLRLVDRMCDALAEHDRDTALSLSDAACRLMTPADEMADHASAIHQSLRAALRAMVPPTPATATEAA